MQSADKSWRVDVGGHGRPGMSRSSDGDLVALVNVPQVRSTVKNTASHTQPCVRTVSAEVRESEGDHARAPGLRCKVLNNDFHGFHGS